MRPALHPKYPRALLVRSLSFGLLAPLHVAGTVSYSYSTFSHLEINASKDLAHLMNREET